jgi:carboxymethylenebutenolidase
MDHNQSNSRGNALDNYLTGKLARREFLRRMALVGGGALVGTTMLGSLACETAAPTPANTTIPTTMPELEPGMTVDPNDPRIDAGPVEFATAAGSMLGYLSRPREGGPNPAILVIHENRGLQPHFPDVARRYALEGYTALAVDLLSRQGGTGTFADSDQARAGLGQIAQDDLMADLNASVDYLQTLSHVQADRIGVTGFCFGGGLTWLMAVRNPEVAAAVPFYGSAPPLDEVANLNIPVLGIYAGNDERIGEGVPGLEAALLEQNKQYQLITYPGADHGFFRDTSERYHQEAAGQAWTAALGLFGEHLKS